MDTLRGTFDKDHAIDDADDFDLGNEDIDTRLPPASIGQDERRMQVRAYNHWAGLLDENNYPSIEDLEPDNLPDFGPHSVLLDFSVGIEDPAVRYLGAALGEECGANGKIEMLSDVPSRSLLSRITDHYMQILANQAPIGFEAEFVNQRGATILYRGILLPFSSDDDTIDFIYGVINWKEMADQATTDELLLEIDQALNATTDKVETADDSQLRSPAPMTQWADGPSTDSDVGADPVDPANLNDQVASEPIRLNSDHTDGEYFDGYDAALPQPAFGEYALDSEEETPEDEDDSEVHYNFASLSDHIAAPAEKSDTLDLDSFETLEDTAPKVLPPEVAPEIAPIADSPLAEKAKLNAAPPLELSSDCAIDPIVSDEEVGLYDYLASARELAHTANSCEDRSRKALYAAVGRAYDFSIAAHDAPVEYDELIADNGLSVQERAPMTPVVKLVFGADYDKTRLTEYATVLSHAHRVGIERGQLAQLLDSAKGGLKGVVANERRLRREESGQMVVPKDAPNAALTQKLRALETHNLDELPAEGAEFALVMIRRTPEGKVVMLGEIADDIALVERAGRKLVG